MNTNFLKNSGLVKLIAQTCLHGICKYLAILQSMTLVVNVLIDNNSNNQDVLINDLAFT